MNQSEIKEKANKAFEDFKKLASETSDPIKKAKMEKALAISEIIIQSAEEVTELAKALGRKKRIFQPKNRMPGRKQQRKLKIFRQIMNLMMARERIKMIMQTPIPKFAPGGNQAGKMIAIVGDNHPEITIHKPGQKSYDII